MDDQAIFSQGLLPLAFDKPISNYKAAAASFGPPLVLKERYPTFYNSGVNGNVTVNKWLKWLSD